MSWKKAACCLSQTWSSFILVHCYSIIFCIRYWPDQMCWCSYWIDKVHLDYWTSPGSISHPLSLRSTGSMIQHQTSWNIIKEGQPASNTEVFHGSQPFLRIHLVAIRYHGNQDVDLWGCANCEHGALVWNRFGCLGYPNPNPDRPVTQET